MLIQHNLSKNIDHFSFLSLETTGFFQIVLFLKASVCSCLIRYTHARLSLPPETPLKNVVTKPVHPLSNVNDFFDIWMAEQTNHSRFLSLFRFWFIFSFKNWILILIPIGNYGVLYQLSGFLIFSCSFHLAIALIRSFISCDFFLCFFV